jgi:hypothetical protein
MRRAGSYYVWLASSCATRPASSELGVEPSGVSSTGERSTTRDRKDGHAQGFPANLAARHERAQRSPMQAPLRDDRAFRNGLPRDPPSGAAILTPAIAATLRAERDRLARTVLAGGLPPEPDAFGGAAGIALMVVKLMLGGESDELGANIEAFSSAYLNAPRRAAPPTDSRKVGFLCGDLGPSVAAMALAGATGSNGDLRERCASALAALAKGSAQADGDELLYGRAGLLHGACLANRLAGEPLLPEHAINSIAERILDAGRTSDDGRLVYRWEGREYLGAAHGYAGIVFMLLHLPRIAASHERALRGTIDFLLDARLPSENFPATADEPDDDRFVQWCHGAPGFVALLCRAASVYRDPRYLELAETSAEIVWERGLLRKGLGLCHGVAGNGYAFLSLYRASNEVVWLHRAIEFGLFCAGETGRSLHGVPEYPLSLYEGLAGTACFLSDLLRPEASWMPGYELPALDSSRKPSRSR